jgi:hypothetical protein
VTGILRSDNSRLRGVVKRSVHDFARQDLLQIRSLVTDLPSVYAKGRRAAARQRADVGRIGVRRCLANEAAGCGSGITISERFAPISKPTLNHGLNPVLSEPLLAARATM